GAGVSVAGTAVSVGGGVSVSVASGDDDSSGSVNGDLVASCAANAPAAASPTSAIPALVAMIFRRIIHSSRCPLTALCGVLLAARSVRMARDAHLIATRRCLHAQAVAVALARIVARDALDVALTGAFAALGRA